MDIRPIEWTMYYAELKAGNYDVSRTGWIADFNDPINMLDIWASDNSYNYAQFGK